MKLDLQTDDALRVLIYVGTNAEALSTIQESADAFVISKAHLMKVVNRLGRLGYRCTLADLLAPRHALAQRLVKL